MKHILSVFLLICAYIMCNGQAQTLVIDNQTPGWLSSKINYSDQETLKNLTVKGYLNGTDIRFIRELNLNNSLQGVIDLSDANIVPGGDAYYFENKTEQTGAHYTQKISSIIIFLRFKTYIQVSASQVDGRYLHSSVFWGNR